MVKLPILYVVIPCYNEEEVLPITSMLFLNKIEELIEKRKISCKSRIMFINDGSKDNTWELICDLAKQNEKYIGISQSRNRGHQNAVLAGLMEAKEYADITISIDCDGQDDIMPWILWWMSISREQILYMVLEVKELLILFLKDVPQKGFINS